MPKKQKVIIKGKTFETVKDACRYYNLNYNTVEKRLSRNWTLEEAFTDIKTIGNSIVIKGKKFKSVKEACRYYNLNHNTVKSRLNNNWSIEEAFELKERKNNNIINVKDKTFKSLSEACRYYNLNYNTTKSRLTKYGWSVEEAFGLVPVKSRRKNNGK